MDPTPKHDNRTRERYDEDPGLDKFYDGAIASRTIAMVLKTTCAPAEPGQPRWPTSYFGPPRLPPHTADARTARR